MNKLKKYPFGLVGLGGCFDHLHEGHHELLKTAAKLGEKIAIAITTEELQKDKEYCQLIEPFETRRKNVLDFLIKLGRDKKDITIIPLSDPFGPAITDPRLEAHISSEETYKVSFKINEKRIENGLKPMVLIIIPLVLNQKGAKLSSTDIRKEICK